MKNTRSYCIAFVIAMILGISAPASAADEMIGQVLAACLRWCSP